MLNLVGALFSGLFVGALARFVYPGAVHLGLFMTMLLGVGGSLLASFVASAWSRRRYGDGINRAGCLASIVGAMALIFIGRHL